MELLKEDPSYDLPNLGEFVDGDNPRKVRSWVRKFKHGDKVVITDPNSPYLGEFGVMTSQFSSHYPSMRLLRNPDICLMGFYGWELVERGSHYFKKLGLSVGDVCYVQEIFSRIYDFEYGRERPPEKSDGLLWKIESIGQVYVNLISIKSRKSLKCPKGYINQVREEDKPVVQTIVDLENLGF